MPEETVNHNTWKVRFAVSLIMLFLAFLGMIFSGDKAWIYWRAITPVYAALSIGLSWYLKRKQRKLWHELAHWAALLLSIYILSLLVSMGFMGSAEGGVETILLLALATFLAGIYTEPTLMVVGTILGLSVVGMGYISKYFYGIALPVIVIALILIFYITRRQKAH